MRGHSNFVPATKLVELCSGHRFKSTIYVKVTTHLPKIITGQAWWNTSCKVHVIALSYGE